MISYNSRKNNEKFSHNGYCYVKDKESADGEKIFWRCDLKNIGCTEEFGQHLVRNFIFKNFIF
jgi:hypothetical protein